MGFSIVGDLRRSGNVIEENAAGNYAMLRMLDLERIDGIVAHVEMIDDLLKRHPQELKSITVTEPIVNSKYYYFVISKKFYKRYPELSKSVWESCAEFQKERLPILLKKYHSLRRQ